MISRRDWVLVIIAVLVIASIVCYAYFNGTGTNNVMGFFSNQGKNVLDTNGRYFANDSTQTNDTRYVENQSTLTSASNRYISPDDSKLTTNTLTFTWNQLRGFPTCQAGETSVASGCILNTGSGGTTNNYYYLNPDGNVYSLHLLSDQNVWQMDLNTIGNLRADGNYLCDATNCYLISDLNISSSGSSSDTLNDVMARGNFTNYDFNILLNHRILLESDQNHEQGELIRLVFENNVNPSAKAVIAFQDYLRHSKAWLVTHYAGTDGTDHNHFSIETSDLTGQLQSRITIPFDQNIANITFNQANVRLTRNTGYTNGNLTLEGNLRHEANLKIYPNEATNSTHALDLSLDADNNILLKALGSEYLVFGDNVIPESDSTYDLGTQEKKWNKINGRVANLIRLGIGKVVDTLGVGIDINSVIGGQGLRIEANGESELGFSIFITGDTSVRATWKGDGSINWSNGTDVTDTNLYRAGINTLGTGGDFNAIGKLTSKEGYVCNDENCYLISDLNISSGGSSSDDLNTVTQRGNFVEVDLNLNARDLVGVGSLVNWGGAKFLDGITYELFDDALRPSLNFNSRTLRNIAGWATGDWESQILNAGEYDASLNWFTRQLLGDWNQNGYRVCDDSNNCNYLKNESDTLQTVTDRGNTVNNATTQITIFDALNSYRGWYSRNTTHYLDAELSAGNYAAKFTNGNISATFGSWLTNYAGTFLDSTRQVDIATGNESINSYWQTNPGNRPSFKMGTSDYVLDANKGTSGLAIAKYTDGNSTTYLGNGTYAFESDGNIKLNCITLGDNQQFCSKPTGGSGTDTNWQTSWGVFDTNVKAEYQLTGTNTLHDHNDFYYSKNQNDINFDLKQNKADLNADVNALINPRNYLSSVTGGLILPALEGSKYLTNNGSTLSWGVSTDTFSNFWINDQNQFIKNIDLNTGLSAIRQQVTRPDSSQYAIQYDGTTAQYARKALANWRSADNVGTVSLWAKTSSAGGYFLVSSDEASDFTFIGFGSTNKINIYLRRGSGTDDLCYGNATDVNNGNWHHLVWDSNGTNYHMYVDGVAQTITCTIGGNNGYWLNDVPNRDNIMSAALKRLSGTIGNFSAQVTIDDISVFSKTLSQSEVSQIYASGLGVRANTSVSPFTTGVVDIWNSDEGTGTNVSDANTSTNNFTLTGTPTWVTGFAFPSPSVTTNLLSCVNGINANEGGICTLGDSTQTPRIVLDGQSIRFNIGGVEKASVASDGNATFGILKGSYYSADSYAGKTGTYYQLCNVDFVGSTKKFCYNTFRNGLLTDTNCPITGAGC